MPGTRVYTRAGQRRDPGTGHDADAVRAAPSPSYPLRPSPLARISAQNTLYFDFGA